MSGSIPASGAATSARRYQIQAASLQPGMFVVELDRPWLDTPFLLQGFLVDSEIELQTLQKYCSYVYVDLDMSNAALADAIRAAELHDEPAVADAQAVAPLRFDTVLDEKPSPAARPPRPVRIRSDIKISRHTRERFRDLVKSTAIASDEGGDPGSVHARAFGLLARAIGGLASAIGALVRAPGASPRRGPADRGGESGQVVSGSRAAILAQLPPGVELRRYAERAPMESELPRAREAFGRGGKALELLVSDMRSGRLPEIAHVSEAVDDMVDSMVDNPDALIWVARLREESTETYQHGVKVALYLIALGRHLGFPRRELSNLGMIGMLADVGKTRLPHALIEKPGMLTPAEYNIVKEHVRLGLEALAPSVKLALAVQQGIAQHHERLDGSGYPKGLKGDEIGIYGRMTAICDSFAALITSRAYANASAPQDALMSLYEWAGTSFHEPLVEQFVQAIGIFPVGSFVELSNGEVAAVLAHNRVRRLEPRVLVLSAPDKTPLGTPFERDLLRRPKDADTGRIRIVRGLAAGAYGLRLYDYHARDAIRAATDA